MRKIILLLFLLFLSIGILSAQHLKKDGTPITNIAWPSQSRRCCTGDRVHETNSPKHRRFIPGNWTHNQERYKNCHHPSKLLRIEFTTELFSRDILSRCHQRWEVFSLPCKNKACRMLHRKCPCPYTWRPSGSRYRVHLSANPKPLWNTTSDGADLPRWFKKNQSL